jgi:hypothetical protein
MNQDFSDPQIESVDLGLDGLDDSVASTIVRAGAT